MMTEEEFATLVEELKAPKIGDIIYIDSALYIDHGEDDIRGGKATVEKIYPGLYGGKTVWVKLEKIPGRSYNWKFLRDRQEEWKAEFGDSWAHPDPDFG